MPPQKIIQIRGRNGIGKTTLIKILTGLIQPNSGKVIFPSNNKHLNIGYLPQKLPLIINSPATVKEVIDTGLFSSSLFTNNNSEKKIQQVVKDIGIEDLIEEKLNKVEEKVFANRSHALEFLIHQRRENENKK